MTDMPSSSQLTQLRNQIDEIDNALLALLAKRQDLSRLIVTKKALGSNVFRPDREVSLLRNLIAAHSTIDPRLIIGLWRQIISASIAEQKPDYTIAHSPKATALAHNHGAGFLNTTDKDDVPQALSCLRDGTADCVIVTADEMIEHADLLVPDEIVIASSIAFLEQEGQERGFILCRDLPLPSGDDVIVMRHDDGSVSHHAKTGDDSADAMLDGVLVGLYARPISRPISSANTNFIK